ncbi:MAG: hypothetical protein HOP14_10665 [Acidobacteria bacterium]|nr:hypothetical protein [Acidobacteriota bacterium]
MRILFLVHNLGKTRHFESVIHALTARRHTVVLGAARKRKPLRITRALHEDPRVEVVPCPVRRIDRWGPHVEALRSTRDYLRFSDPRYGHVTKIVARAADYAPPGLSAALDRRPWLKRNWRRAQQALALAETVIPPDRYLELFLRAERPDLVMVTPLVDFGSYQTDYVKAAHRLGVPVVFAPFSWDNLTNRGLVRVPPDRVLVWNGHQRREAIDLHGMPADRVVVTGAPRFDDFLALRPASSREAFLGPLGLDASKPLLLYVCSSSFVAPREVDFVRAWVSALRGAAPPLRDCQVLIRPHPAHQEQWDAVSFGEVPGVAIWNAKTEMNADQGLYDSLHHAAAVVGLNTSAMIEAAIVGRAVYTVASPEFSGGQSGTIHFAYLLDGNGGPVTSASDFPTHLAQLGRELADPEASRARCASFVASFVRPRGLERTATSVMVEEIEAAGTIRKRPRRGAPWHLPVRWALGVALDQRLKGRKAAR